MKKIFTINLNFLTGWILVLFLLPAGLFADTVLLRDGSSINGRIIQQNQANVVIVSGNKRRVISKRQIARILYNNNYGNDDAEEDKKREEELRRQQEERRQAEAERKRLEEQRRKQQEEQEEQKRQQEILDRIEQEKAEQAEETREQETTDPVEEKTPEELAREERERREQQRKDSSFWESDLWRTLIGEEVNRHEIRFRLEGGAGRIRPVFIPFSEEFNQIRGPLSQKSITSSPASYVDGASYGGEIEYLYDRFLVKLSSKRLEAAHSQATFELGTTTDVLTGLPTDSFLMDLDYARDLNRVEHAVGLGFTAYSNEFLEVRPVAEYIGQFTFSNNDGSAFGFQTSALSYFGLQSATNRMWLRGVRGSLEVLYSFQLMGQSFQWKLRGGAVQLQGSAVSESRGQFFDSGGAYTGERTFRLDPKIFYEGTSLESTLYYNLLPEVRLYVGLAGQTGKATVTEPNIAQNFSNLAPLDAYYTIQSYNENLKFGGLRDHHSRISFGAEYRLGL